MASLFDQYEQSNVISNIQNINYLDPQSQINSIINISSDNEVPIFSRHKVDFTPPEAITHLLVCNNRILIALCNKKLLFIDLTNPRQPNEIDLNRSLGERSNVAKIHQVFLDPTGRHCIISLISTDTQMNYDNIYLLKKPHQLPKIKGHIINAVGWNFSSCSQISNSTSNILIGTTKGLIFETQLLESDESKFFATSTPEQYWKQVFDLGFEAGKVTAIEFHKIPSSNSIETAYFIIVTTKNRLYQLVGNVPSGVDPPILLYVFNTYSGQFNDMPGHLGFSKLDFYYPSSFSIPKTFGWLTEPGIFFGKIDISNPTPNSTVTSDTNLIPYKKEDDDNFSSREKPISMVITQFHVLVLFRNCFKAICVLNEEVVFEDYFTETYGRMIGIAKDPAKGTVWIYSEMAVYRYKIVQEDRNIWQIYLDEKNFNRAKYYAKNDSVKLDKVICEEAQHYFNLKNYEKSASLYAQSHKSFEEVALKFLQIGEDEALKEFLVCKLDTLNSKDIAQMTMILLWLFEILLNQMGCLGTAEKENTEEYKLYEAEFKSLLSQEKIKNCLIKSKKAMYDLISSHGNESNLIYFASLMKDYDKVIQYYLQHKNYHEALEVLQQQSDPELYYTFAPVLMQEIPHELISALIKIAPKIDSEKLIPALVQQRIIKSEGWDLKQGIETIRYLEYCAFSLSYGDSVIHNYLLALYAQMQPDKLMTYLSIKGQDESSIPYDLKYALRICTEYSLEKACVHLYSIIKMYEEAVDLALTFDVELAKDIADKTDSNEELRKKLWLKIAKHVVDKEKDVKKATQFLQECELLKIEDILPFFPDFITIDHFKDAICSSLEEYNRHIESLKEEMKSATESASEIREEIKEFRNKFTIVKTTDKCIVCSYAILTRAFYVFPCGHMFHSDCLISEVMPHLSSTTQNRIEDVQKQLSVYQNQQNKPVNDLLSSNLNSIAATNAKEKLLNQLDDIVASECLYCGSIMIDSIDEPFVSHDNATLAMDGWD